VKVCTKCGKKKELGEFYNCKACTDGKLNVCKDCFRRYRRERYWAKTAGKTPIPLESGKPFGPPGHWSVEDRAEVEEGDADAGE
jgi:hypothetical protein